MKTTLYLTIPLMILVMTACNTKDNAGKYHTQDAMDAIFARTSIRSYQPQAVEEEKIELLLRAGMAAPSGKNVQPWELVVVDDRAALDAMAAALPYAKMLAQAPMAIVVCADTTKSREHPPRSAGIGLGRGMDGYLSLRRPHGRGGGDACSPRNHPLPLCHSRRLPG